MSKHEIAKELDWTNPLELLRAAADDIEICIKQDDVTLNMDEWYSSADQGTTCEVCMAGAVVLNRLETFIDKDYNNLYFGRMPKAQQTAMRALDAFRSGSSNKFCDYMNIPHVNCKLTYYNGYISDDKALQLASDARDFADKLESIEQCKGNQTQS